MVAKNIRPNAYDDDGYSYECKACMARSIAEESVVQLERNLRHVFRDVETLIKASASPVPVKVRKRSGLDFRRQKIATALDGLLGGFYEVWADLEERGDHDRATVTEFRKARKKGAAAKKANDPTTQAAKDYAVAQWPEAHRRGLTALAFHGRLVTAGHSVQPDTVRKWVTNLRKSGTC